MFLTVLPDKRYTPIYIHVSFYKNGFVDNGQHKYVNTSLALLFFPTLPLSGGFSRWSRKTRQRGEHERVLASVSRIFQWKGLTYSK